MIAYCFFVLVAVLLIAALGFALGAECAHRENVRTLSGILSKFAKEAR